MMKPFLAILGGFVVSLGMFASGAAVATFFLAVEPVREPDARQDVAELWSSKPRSVKPEAQNLQRIPAAPVSTGSDRDRETQVAMADTGTETQVAVDDTGTETQVAVDDTGTETQVAMADTGTMSDAAPQTDDTITTGSVHAATSDDEERSTGSNEFSAAHLEWCADHYRSYRPATNTYTAYSGEQQPCASPYLDRLGERDAPRGPRGESRVDFAGDSPDPQLLQYASDQPAGNAYLSPEHVRDCLSRYRSYRPEDNTYQPYGGGPRRQCR